MKDQPKTKTSYGTVTPYLIVEEAEAFQHFMEKVFQAREQYKQQEPQRGIVHAEVVIGDSVIMFAEATEQWKVSPAGMFILVKDVEGTYQAALKEGAVSLGEPADQSYGRSAGVVDPFGNTWWITSMPSS